MALTRDKKTAVVNEIKALLTDSKLSVVATYNGTSVKSMQNLRSEAKASSTVVKVYKNRLVKKAMEEVDSLKSTDTSLLKGQLLYAFNSQDEVAPAQVLANFAKNEPQIAFIGAINTEGQFIGADDVKALSSLPSKDNLRAQLIGTFSAPLSSFVSVLNANTKGLLAVLNARAESIGN